MKTNIARNKQTEKDNRENKSQENRTKTLKDTIEKKMRATRKLHNSKWRTKEKKSGVSRFKTTHQWGYWRARGGEEKKKYTKKKSGVTKQMKTKRKSKQGREESEIVRREAK